MIWPYVAEAKEDLDEKKPKKSTDAITKFQNGWITKLLWAKGCVRSWVYPHHEMQGLFFNYKQGQGC